MADLAQQETDLPVILASSSPRRAELLSLIYKKFTVVTPLSETDANFSSPSEEAAAKAYEKGQDVFLNNKDSLVISADTIVVKNGLALGKPKDKAEALKMLSLLSGGEHSVISAVSIFAPEIEHSFISKTKVWFFTLSEYEIEEYIESEKPYDKAGAYGIQGAAARFIEKIEGDFHSVMGLPVSQVYQTLKTLNLIKKR